MGNGLVKSWTQHNRINSKHLWRTLLGQLLLDADFDSQSVENHQVASES